MSAYNRQGTSTMYGTGPLGQSTWPPVVLRLFDYLTTVPADRAMRVLGLWPDNIPLEEFARLMVAAIPSTWYTSTHWVPEGPRLVYQKGLLVWDENKQEREIPEIITFHHFEVPADTAETPGSRPRKRSINSFMAFRTFPGARQAAKSLALAEMWPDDPLKPQWSLIARAYTVVRDNFILRDTSLFVFTQHAARIIGMPESDRYLETCGFSARLYQDGRIQIFESFGPQRPLRIRTTTVHEIVDSLLRVSGYGMERLPNSTWPYRGGSCQGQMAVTKTSLDSHKDQEGQKDQKDQKFVDDPLAYLFDELPWDLTMFDTNDVIDNSLDPMRHLVTWPAQDLEALKEMRLLHKDASSFYRKDASGFYHKLRTSGQSAS
ncbi:Mating-type protein MAT alpha 1 [Penicillium argentinense]|uniref:Mating-type protein MAT alpha 1 n=1 Tax=Penicillium argentinense TaxID=1131581 RepID=A0A9W9G445_9EURO|nr:Mating-type protein MAT alpha 1 [Penicillium argentinense]KAJ5110932.1 Mating-type protein MAT alpha 1 [Penicillium argentinense]